jgi:NAD(P)-dependent dehydrogenase (short-subunit alcohol dehydrogenase family)
LEAKRRLRTEDEKHKPIQHRILTGVPPQAGRLAVVTGATGGLGFETAVALARASMDVIVAGRNEARGREALRRIRPLAPDALIRFEKLDLADLRSVSAFADRLREAGRAVDLLVNNAGVMALPRRRVTADGFEMQLGSNYLGHFALTGLLLPLVRRSRWPRVVQVSSIAHRCGAIRFHDLHWESGYKPWAAYSQSKLAMLLFAFELQRRSDQHGWGLLSNAAHPGFARTDLIANGPGTRSLLACLSLSLGSVVSQSASDGALPTLFAATSPEVQPAGYYGPRGFFGLRGRPTLSIPARRARDRNVARRLWEVSEQLTGVRFPGAG